MEMKNLTAIQIVEALKNKEFTCETLVKYYLENIENKAHLGEYRRRELLTGNYITANTGGETVEGFAAGIDDNANLILRLADGNEKSLFSGEANLCRIRRQK